MSPLAPTEFDGMPAVTGSTVTVPVAVEIDALTYAWVAITEVSTAMEGLPPVPVLFVTRMPVPWAKALLAYVEAPVLTTMPLPSDTNPPNEPLLIAATSPSFT